MAQPLDGGAGGSGGGADGGGGEGRKRRRSAHKPVLASEPPGANCRLIYCADPVLTAAYLGPAALLVVSRCWGCWEGGRRPPGLLLPALLLPAAAAACLLRGTAVAGCAGRCCARRCWHMALPQQHRGTPVRPSAHIQPLPTAPTLRPQVERPWAEVFKAIAAPMWRHRYGT